MFTEIQPILGAHLPEEKRTTIVITISPTSTGLVVMIVPKPNDPKADNAMKTPLSVHSTAEELDRDFGKILSTYTESYLTMAESLDRARAEMANAVKEANATAAAKKNEAKGKVKGKPEEKPVEAPSLFGGEPEFKSVFDSTNPEEDSDEG